MAKIELTDQNFQDEVLNEKEMPVLVDFWAPWCGPCQQQGPIVDELATDYEGKVKIGAMDVDKNPNRPSTYGVMSIPTMMVFKDGKPADTLVGFRDKEQLAKALDKYIS